MATTIDVAMLRKAVRSGSPALVRRLLEKLDAQKLAHTLSDLPPAERKLVLTQLLTDDRLGRTLNELPEDLLGEVFSPLDDALIAVVLNDLYPEDATRTLLCLDADRQDEILKRLDPARAQLLSSLMRYPPDSAAGNMTPHFVSVAPDATVDNAIRAIREAGSEVPLFYLYVEEAGELVGAVALSHLVKASDNTTVGEIMATDVVSVAPDADQEEVARLVARRNLLAVPVVEGKKLIGLVTVDNVLDVLEEEATEDMYNMAGLSEGDRVFSPPSRSLVKRLPWNALNLVTALMVATVVSFFEGTIAQLALLATFMPVVAGIGGNTGNQTLTVIIRGITLGELEFSSGLRALFKEVAVGVSIGVILGSAVALVTFLWKGSLVLGLVIALAMIANLFIGALVGTAIPLTLKKLGHDPAMGGSILVTMCTDIFGNLFYLGLATIFISHLLP
jgi:magnesium transporter